ncbi:beta-galactosidase, partial [Virgibacillus halodenitrificans]|nr:beta-galactosidase [Virgibacillus halodenitrificans]
AGKGYEKFQSYVGLDREANNTGTINFQVFADGEKLFESGVMRRDTPAKLVDVDITGKEQLKLVVTDGGDNNGNDHADWADAKFMAKTDETKPEVITMLDGKELKAETTLSVTDEVSFTWEARDEGSGIDKVAATLDGEAYEQGTELNLAGKPGEHQLVVTATDKAGNTVEATYVLKVTTSAAAMQALVDRYAVEDAFDAEKDARLLKHQLTTIQLFEDKEEMEKAWKHLQRFTMLLDKQYQRNTMSEEVYEVLQANAEYLLELWQ